MPPLDIPPPDDLIRLTEAVRLLQCHYATVHRWIQTGKLPGWRRVGTWFVSRADCLAMFRKGARKPVCQPHETPEYKRQTDAAMAYLRARGVG